MADHSDRRPDRWWVLDPEGHHLHHCGNCGAELDLSHTVPMLVHEPLCAICAGGALVDAPMTATYLQWLSDGDPRRWSPWMCNCQHCDAEGVLDP